MSAPKKKPLLVEYRRNSSDMDMSTSESEEETTGNNSYNSKSSHIDSKIITSSVTSDSVKVNTNNLSDCDRLRESRHKDDRREESKKERSKPRDEKDTRRSYQEKSRSSPERHERSRRSPDRSHGHHHRHRSRSPRHRRSPVRPKHSPPRRDRDRKRSHSPERSRRRSPDFRSKRLERKVARIDKLGIEITTEPRDGTTTFTNSNVNSYCTPMTASSNLARITEQIQKRRLLWGNKKEVAPDQCESKPSGSGVETAWQAATFKGDSDGKMTEKFKRLMGMKGEISVNSGPSSSAPAGNEIIKKQEEMFSNMEAQYQVARMATHTHRGIGLGFGTFQVPPQ